MIACYKKEIPHDLSQAHFFTEEVNDLFGTDMTQCEIARLVRQCRTLDEGDD